MRGTKHSQKSGESTDDHLLESTYVSNRQLPRATSYGTREPTGRRTTICRNIRPATEITLHFCRVLAKIFLLSEKLRAWSGLRFSLSYRPNPPRDKLSSSRPLQLITSLRPSIPFSWPGASFGHSYLTTYSYQTISPSISHASPSGFVSVMS